MSNNVKLRWSLPTTCLMLVCFFSSTNLPRFAHAYSPQENQAPADTTKPADPLADEQTGLAKQFGDLENLLLKLSEIEADTNPVRASILQRASKLGKETSLQARLKEAAKALENQQFSRAIEEQQATKESLEQLLTLLLSEDRDDRVREEKKKIEEMIKEIQRLNRLQKSLRQRTESSDNPQELSEDQGGLEQKANELAKDLDAGSEDEKAPSQSDSGEMPNGDQEGAPTETPETEKPKTENPVGDGDTKTPQPDKEPSAEPSDNSEGQNKEANNSEGNNKEEGSNKEGTGKEGTNKEGEPQTDMPSEEPKSEGETSKPNDKPPTTEDKEKTPSDKPEDGQSSETKNGEENAQDGESKPSNSNSKPQEGGDQPPSPPQPSQEGQPSPDSQEANPESSGERPPPNAQQPTQPKTPQQRVEQARKKMEEAKKKLEDAEKDQAVEAQKQAEEELRQAVDELEQILRQLREEEVERTLVQLETRFRRMLEMQLEVNEETKKLDRIASDQRERAWQQRAVNLSQGERKIVEEAERALLLLREEGTSLAFPEAGEQLLADMQTVASRLDGSDVGALTQTIESEIVTGLEEILEALSTAQKDLEKKKNEEGAQPPPPQPGQPQQQPLVDKLAELRLIRTMQMRINTRTTKLAELMGTKEDAIGLTEQGEMRQQIRDLGGRQQRLQQITRDIVVGRAQ